MNQIRPSSPTVEPGGTTPPSLTLPLKGGGENRWPVLPQVDQQRKPIDAAQTFSPSPLEGEGRGGGYGATGPALANSRTSRSTPRLALAALSLSMLMPSLDTSIANVSLPSLGAIFAAPFQSVQWVVLSYLLTITSLIVGAGRLGDLIGRRRLLLVGILIFTAASLACGLAPTLPLLIAARGLQGLGAAIMMALTVALVSGTVPKERTGRAMGLLGTMSAVGTSLGPSLGGLIVAHADWRFIFLINVPLGLLNWGLAAHALPRDVNRARDAALPSPAADVKKPRFDPWGTLLLAATLGAYALAMTVGEGAFGAGNVALLAAAVLGMLAFIATERRVAAPLLRLSLFRREGLSLSLALTLIVAAVVMGTFVVGPFYLSAGLGLSAGAVGLTMSAGPLMSALAGVPAGRLVDRFGARRMMLQGLIGMVLGLAALCSAPMLFGVAGYVGAIMLTTSHYALFQAANNTGIMHGVGADERGLVSGMLSLARNLGLVTGAALLGAIFAYGAGGRVTDGIDPAAITHGLRLAFGSVGTVLCLGLVAALLPRRPKASTRD